MRILPIIVLRALLRKSNWLRFANVISVETFGTLSFRRIYDHMRRLHEVTSGDLTIEALMADLEIAYSSRPEFLTELQEVVFDIQDAVEVEADLLERKVREFVQRELSEQAATYVVTNLHSPDFSVDVLADLVARAVEVGGRVDAQVVGLHASPLSRSADLGPARVGLGYTPELDRALGGGVGVGELAVLLAPPSRGKTSYLCAAGAHAAGQGLGVLHVTLEIRTEMVVRRYDQALTHLTREGLDETPGHVEAARETLQARGGEVWVKDWSNASVRASDVEALVRRMRARQQRVDFLIVDYAALMSPNEQQGKQAQLRQTYGAIGKELRALSVKLQVPLLTAWQVNRDGSDTNTITGKDISECWDILMHADTVLGLNQSNAELLAHRMRLNIIKQRQDTGRDQFRLYSDLRRMEIRPATDEDDRAQQGVRLTDAHQNTDPS